ncbi:unnamed protein product [Coregonus sp. 'balchen']|nr:unnamed protein product [Coregonus sp. 'balchen']
MREERVEQYKKKRKKKLKRDENPIINEEFQRLTTNHLEPRFMAMLDQDAPKLLSLFHSKGGALGHRLRVMLDVLLQEVEGGDVLQELAQHVMKIYVIKKEGAMASDDPEEIGIVLEGVLITGLGNVTQACAILLSMTYALNLSYPKKLKYTFEAFQKLFVQLDCSKLTVKMTALKNKLLS